MTARLVMLRHAATGWNEAGILQGRTDRPLSPAGAAQAARWRLPENLAPSDDEASFSSPLVRCRETARLMGLRPAIEPDLIETAWGQWEGRRLADIRAADPEGLARRERAGLDFHPPDGESARQVQARVAPFLARRAAAGGTAVAVTHRGVIRAVYALAVRWDMTGPPPDKLRDGCAQVFSLGEGGFPAVSALNRPLFEAPGGP